MNNLNQRSPITLKQSRFPFGSRELILDNHNDLTINERSLLRRDSTKISLDILQSSPASSRTFSVKWFFNSIVLVFLSAFVYWFAETYALPILHALTLLVITFTVFAIYQFFVNTTSLLIYRNAYTNEHYLYLWNNRPNKKSFDNFVSALNQRIDGFEQEKSKSPSERIERYSQHLALLHKENIINDGELSKLSKRIYEKALDEC